MNTRGLTELVILSVGLGLGIITTNLFTMMVVMALFTTLMATPMLALVFPIYHRGMTAGEVRAMKLPDPGPSAHDAAAEGWIAPEASRTRRQIAR